MSWRLRGMMCVFWQRHVRLGLFGLTEFDLDARTEGSEEVVAKADEEYRASDQQCADEDEDEDEGAKDDGEAFDEFANGLRGGA